MADKVFFKRLIEKKIQENLRSVGGMYVFGPRNVGKTTLCERYAKTFFNLANHEDRLLAQNNPSFIFQDRSNWPILIDEWQIVPQIWTMAKTFIDRQNKVDIATGIVIFTGSIWLKKREILDPGIGRFAPVFLRPLSLYESNDSECLVSISGILDNPLKPQKLLKPFSWDHLVEIICRGGFPEAVERYDQNKNINFTYVQLIEQFLNTQNAYQFKPKTFRAVFTECSRICTQQVNWNKMANRLSDLEPISGPTVHHYTDILSDLYLVEFLGHYSNNFSSAIRFFKKDKLYFCDPAIAIAALDLHAEKLIRTPSILGAFFENLVYRDLKNYADYLDAKLFYYRDVNGNEVDFIMEFPDGRWIAIEVKLGSEEEIILSAAKTLVKFKKICYEQMVKAHNEQREKRYFEKEWLPAKLVVITGMGGITYEMKYLDETIVVIPISALMP